MAALGLTTKQWKSIGSTLLLIAAVIVALWIENQGGNQISSGVAESTSGQTSVTTHSTPTASATATTSGTPTSAPPTSTSTTASASSVSSTAATATVPDRNDPDSGLPWIGEDEISSEGRAVLRLIDAGGPFPYPEDDGGVFGNYEGILPSRSRGYYHEYTVPTPGERYRGARRIVTGGSGEYYWTDDHYQSFSRIWR